MKILITGSSGYYGQILSKFLSKFGNECHGLDIIDDKSSNLNSFSRINLLDNSSLRSVFQKNQFDAIIHLASQIDFAAVSQVDLYKNNLDSTRNLLTLSVEFGIKKIIFTSSNSIFLGNRESVITDTSLPSPIDLYGKSKIDCENLLLQKSNNLEINIIRCPNIIDAGRVGMLSILFELLENSATLWMLNSGVIRHQTIYAEDLNIAILKTLAFKGSSVHNIGCDDVKSFHEIFSILIKEAKSNSKLRSLPASLIMPLLKFSYLLNISPLGPYQFRMLTRDFQFDTSRIKKDLDWFPTKNNAEILLIAYDYYIKNKEQISNNKSANSGKVKMGILKLLKLIKI